MVVMQGYVIYHKRSKCNPFYTLSNTSQKELKITGTFILYNFVCAWNNVCLKRKILCFVIFITDSDMVKIRIKPTLKKGVTNLRPKDTLAEKEYETLN